MNNFNHFTNKQRKSNKINGISDLVILSMANLLIIVIISMVLQNYKAQGLFFLKFSLIFPVLSIIYLFLRPQIVDKSERSKYSKFYVNGFIVSLVLIGFVVAINSMSFNMSNFENIAKIVLSVFITVSLFTLSWLLIQGFLSPLFSAIKEAMTFRKERIAIERQIFLSQHKQFLIESVEREKYVSEQIKKEQSQTQHKQNNNNTNNFSYKRPGERPHSVKDHDVYNSHSVDDKKSTTERLALSIKKIMIENSIDYLTADSIKELAKNFKVEINAVHNALNSSYFNQFKSENGSVIYTYHTKEILMEILGATA